MVLSHVRALTAAGVCVAAVALAGCGSGAPSVAAEVGGQRITDAQVTSAYDGIRQAFGAETEVSKQAVIDALIRGQISEQLAVERNVTITDAERDSALSADESGAKLLTVPAAKVVAYDLADEQIMAAKLGQEQYIAALGQAKVTVNPRYGSWGTVNGQTGLIGVPGSLSSPAGLPTPAN